LPAPPLTKRWSVGYCDVVNVPPLWNIPIALKFVPPTNEIDFVPPWTNAVAAKLVPPL
jgi:hypothetical protein